MILKGEEVDAQIDKNYEAFGIGLKKNRKYFIYKFKSNFRINASKDTNIEW